jgi:hypothetical protein
MHIKNRRATSEWHYFDIYSAAFFFFFLPADQLLPGWIHVIDDHEIANDWDQKTEGVSEPKSLWSFKYETSRPL